MVNPTKMFKRKNQASNSSSSRAVGRVGGRMMVSQVSICITRIVCPEVSAFWIAIKIKLYTDRIRHIQITSH